MPTNGATKTRRYELFVSTAELPRCAANRPTGPSAAKTPADEANRQSPRTELLSSRRAL